MVNPSSWVFLIFVLSDVVLGFQLPLSFDNRATGFLCKGTDNGRTSSICASSVKTAVRGLRASRIDFKMSGSAQVIDAETFAAKSEVLAALSVVQDPVRGESLTKLGAIKSLEVDISRGSVRFICELSVADPSGKVKKDCETAVRDVAWVKGVEITMAALPPQEDIRQASLQQASGLSKVKNVIACASCKGGVGKSTTAVNLAFSLKALGYKVGIFDVDIYGPSLPTMVTPERPFQPDVDIVGNMITPLTRDGVKLMSIGFINPKDSFILRGAKVSPLAQQLVSTTQWGDLDYLVIDMPPGTGDIHLTLSQMEVLKIDAAVIVTTPQRLSFIDVVKGVEMFDKVGIPSVAVVENMAYYAATNLRTRAEQFAAKHSLSKEASSELLGLLEEKEYIFGGGHKQRLLDMWGIENSYSMPLSPDIARQGDSGVPFVVYAPTSEAAMIYRDLAQAVVGEVTKIKVKAAKLPLVTYDAATGMMLLDGHPTISAPDLRRRW